MKKVLLSFLVIIQFNTLVVGGECKGAGVAITFDDIYVDSWYTARHLFIKYNAKATYFITRPHTINEDGFKKLRKLQDDGHEMAAHTLNHKGIEKHYYSDPSLVEQYLDEEVIPSIKILEDHGLKISSFAHPYGQHTEEYDEMLLQNFLFIRATTYSWGSSPIVKVDNAFYSRNNTSGLIYGVGIDNIYKNPVEEIEEGMIRAKENSEVLILYGHEITENEGNYRTSQEKIEAILKSAVELGLEFYTISELRTLCK